MKLRSNCWSLTSQYSRDKVSGKEILLYSGGQKLRERVDLMSKGHLPTNNQWARAFKAEFQGCIGRGRRLHADIAVSSNSHLEISYTVV